MKRGSSRLRLPRGKRSLKASPMLIGIAIFLAVLVPTIFYLFSDGDSPGSFDSLSSGPDTYAAYPPDSNKKADITGEISSEPVLKIASSDISLLAVVDSGQDLSQVYLENTGIIALHKIRVIGRDGALGTLSELDPGEKKVLSISGRAEKIDVSAMDPTGLEIQGQVRYNSSAKQLMNASQNALLNTKAIIEPVPFSMSIPAGAAVPAGAAIPAAPAVPAVAEPPVPEKPVAPAIAEGAEPSPLALNISVNRSAGLAGEMVSFRCTASNAGDAELSDVRITCAGKNASTRFLTPHKELVLDGILKIENSSRLLAEASAKDGKGGVYSSNKSIDILMISSLISLKVTAPPMVHRGEKVSIQIRIENTGNDNLTDLKVSDGYGSIAGIPLLAPGEFQSLQAERVITKSLTDEVRVLAHDESGREVFASQSFMLGVMNSSLEIHSEVAEVGTYPGKPAEVTWILSNTGEETIGNVTLKGDETDIIIPRMLPGRSVRMAAIYIKNGTSWINVTARGRDNNGFEATATGSVLLKAVQPGINLEAMPAKVEAAPGETATVSCLVTNSGEDRLKDVVLTEDGATIASIGNLEPGEFRVVDAKTVVSSNRTIQYVVKAKDSQDRLWSDGIDVQARAVAVALKIFASASPSAVVPGDSSLLTCTVANTGNVPLYSIFVISDNLGPLGSIDYLSPKHQKTVTAKKEITREVEDIITAEGFTMDKNSVQGSCSLNIVLLKGTALDKEGEEPKDHSDYNIRMAPANISYGNMSLPFNLPEEDSTITQVSGRMASDIDSSAERSNNAVLDGVSNLLRYVERLLGLEGSDDGSEQVENATSADYEYSSIDVTSEISSIDASIEDSENRVADGSGNVSQSASASMTIPQAKESPSGSENYELSIEGVKSSEHGAIAILDVNAMPSQPAAEEDVKITAHIKSDRPIVEASLKYGLSEAPLTKKSMLGIDRIYDSELVLESGDVNDGYWSGTVSGEAAGTYMPLSVWISDGSSTAEGGPYLIHWSTVNTAEEKSRGSESKSLSNSKLFIESTTVKGEGEVSIKDNFNGASMHYNEKMIGNGSISMDTQRSIDRKASGDNFSEVKDLVFTGGNLKGHKTVASPRFDGGMGASVSERYNLSHVDRSESSSVSGAGYTNNSLNFKTDQAFNGTWNIQTSYAKLFKKVKNDQQYSGSFQTQKDIQFKDDT